MHCPYLSHNDEQCNAGESPYSPSEFELDEYCATPQHMRCPFYCNETLLEIRRFGRIPDHDHAHRVKKVTV